MRRLIDSINSIESIHEAAANLARQEIGQLFVRIKDTIQNNQYFTLVGYSIGPKLESGKGFYDSDSQTLNARNAELRKLQSNHRSAPVFWQKNERIADPGDNRAFIMLYIQDNLTKELIIWGDWLKSWNLKKPVYPMSGAVRKRLDMRQANKDSWLLKPGDIFPKNSPPLDSNEVVNVILNDANIPESIKTVTKDFMKSSSMPLTIKAGTIQDQGQYDAFMVYFCEILHPLGLIKSNSLNYGGIDKLKQVSDKVFGSPDSYQNTKIRFDDESGSVSEAKEAGKKVTSLYDSMLVSDDGRQVIISTKRGEGVAPNISSIYNRYLSLAPKVKKSIDDQFSPEIVRIFNILGSSKTPEQDKSEMSVFHVMEVAKDLGIIDDRELAKVRDIWFDPSVDYDKKHHSWGDSNMSLKGYDNLSRILALGSEYPTNRQNLFYNLGSLVKYNLNKNDQIRDLVTAVLNTIGFIQIHTYSDEYDPNKDLSYSFQIKRPKLDETTIKFNVNLNYMVTDPSPSSSARFNAKIVDRKNKSNQGQPQGELGLSEMIRLSGIR